MSGTGAPPRGAPPPEPPDEERLRLLSERLCTRLSAVRTDSLRTGAAADELKRLRPAESVLVVGNIARRSRDSRSAADALAAITRALGCGLVEPDYLADCLAAARSRADRVCEALFATGRARSEYSVEAEEFVDRKLRALSLGERRALTRHRDRDWLARLAHDQDPLVVRQLLRNPRVTEREALIAAARRPTGARVLEEVLASRFGPSPRIRRAIAQNPYSPVALAMRALATLPAQDLRAVADDHRVTRAVRAHARSLLVARAPTPAERAQGVVPPLPDEDRALLAALVGRLEESLDGAAMQQEGLDEASPVEDGEVQEESIPGRRRP